MLEAAVALEAWAGVPAQRALDDGARGDARRAPPSREPSTGALPEPRERARRAGRGADVPDDGDRDRRAGPRRSPRARARTSSSARVMLALPRDARAAVGAQLPLLLARARPRRARAPARRCSRSPRSCSSAPRLAVRSGRPGLIAALLTVTWVAAAPCSSAAAGAAPTRAASRSPPRAMLLGPDPAAAARRASPPPSSLAALLALRPRRRRRRGAPAALDRVAGGGGDRRRHRRAADRRPDRELDRGRGAGASRSCPSAAAGFWASYRMRDLGVRGRRARPRACASAPPRRAALASPPLRAAARARSAGWPLIAAVLSAALLLLTSWLGEPADAAGVLAGFGLLAPPPCSPGVLESLGRARRGRCAALAAAARARRRCVRWGERRPFAGAGLVAGGLVATALLLPLADRRARPAGAHARDHPVDHMMRRAAARFAVPAAAGAIVLSRSLLGDARRATAPRGVPRCC